MPIAGNKEHGHLLTHSVTLSMYLHGERQEASSLVFSLFLFNIFADKHTIPHNSIL